MHDLAVQHAGFDVTLVDLAEVGLPLLDEPRPPQRGQYEHEHTRRWSEIVRAADAYVLVVPEYNHSYNAATKNALDYLAKEWRASRRLRRYGGSPRVPGRARLLPWCPPSHGAGGAVGEHPFIPGR